MDQSKIATAISIVDLAKTYKAKKGAVVDALRMMSLSVSMGEVFGFLGPNGAGKTTTIKCLVGLIKPTSGTAKILDKDVSLVDARNHIGYLPENPTYYDFLTAEEYLRFIALSFKMPEYQIVAKSEEVLKLVELWDVRNRSMRSYSKGMVQRLGIAQVLIHDPDIYILDEPMSGLDPLGRILVKNIISDLKARGKCVFFSTHIIADVETICDRVGIIYKGELKAVENIESIFNTGVVGYTVHLKTKTGQSTHVTVPKDEFQSFILSATNRGEIVQLVEPERKNLEDFFLEIVDH